jgi:hypothetical protein
VAHGRHDCPDDGVPDPVGVRSPARKVPTQGAAGAAAGASAKRASKYQGRETGKEAVRAAQYRAERAKGQKLVEGSGQVYGAGVTRLEGERARHFALYTEFVSVYAYKVWYERVGARLESDVCDADDVNSVSEVNRALANVAPECMAAYDEVYRAAEAWPPSEDHFMEFCAYAHAVSGTYKVYVKKVANVCYVGMRMWAKAAPVLQGRREVGDLVASQQADPRVLYQKRAQSYNTLVKREFGQEVYSVQGTTMPEARNGAKFHSQTSMQGIQQSALWCIGQVSGGRRPSTICAMRLADLSIKAESVNVDGGEWLVPETRYEFRHEKVMDDRGNRSIRERYAGVRTYGSEYVMSAAYYIYKLLVLRDVLVGGNPLLTCKANDEILVKDECKDYFLFCTVRDDDTWFDMEPLGVKTLSAGTAETFKRMGSKARGYKAHRHGIATRVMQQSMLDNKGKGVDGSTERALKRLGGWSGKTTNSAVRSVYQGLVLDEGLDTAALAYGMERDNAVAEARRREFMGRDIPMDEINLPADTGVNRYPWAVRMAIWEEVAEARRASNVLALHLWAAGVKHEGLGRLRGRGAVREQWICLLADDVLANEVALYHESRAAYVDLSSVVRTRVCTEVCKAWWTRRCGLGTSVMDQAQRELAAENIRKDMIDIPVGVREVNLWRASEGSLCSGVGEYVWQDEE